MKLYYFDPSPELYTPSCAEELLQVLSWATLNFPCIYTLCGTVSTVWVTVTTQRDRASSCHTNALFLLSSAQDRIN